MKKINFLMIILAMTICSYSRAYPEDPGESKPADSITVKSGLDNLLENPDMIPKNKRLGIIVNHSSVNASGKHIVDLLTPGGYQLKKIFTTEHGFRGHSDNYIKDSVDNTTGLPVVSLYKSNKKAPTDDDLKDIDILIFDIQEIGVRYYTYATSMILAMKMAAKNKKSFIVLDRPNMAGELGAYGPILSNEFRKGFAGYYPIPMAHGMTIGELARFYNDYFKIGVELKVIQMINYKRSMYYDETGLPWIKPSPNICNVDSAIAYQIIGSLEALKISVGRGTETPFLLYGAPHFNGRKMTQELNNAGLPGVEFEYAEFIPTNYNYKGKTCSGFRLSFTDRHKIDPMKIFLTIAREIYLNLPEKKRDIKWGQASGSVGSRKVLIDIAKGTKIETIIETIEKDIQPFMQERKKYLMYQ